MHTSEIYIGVDVSKYTLELSPFDKAKRSVPNTRAGLRSLIKRIQKLDNKPIICCEATGGYEKLLVSACHDQDIQIAVVNARQVRDYAKSKGILAKTDAIDAAVLAGYAKQNQPRLTQKTEPWRISLKELHKRRDELKRMMTQERNRQENLEDVWVATSIRKHLHFLRKQVDAVDEALRNLVKSEPELRTFCDRFMQVKGIGIIAASAFVAYLPEMGRVTDNELVALAGLAPHCQDSGTWKGQRHISGGRAAIRNILYMPAINAKSSNPIFKEVYDRLTGNGKPAKVALTAIMRKMVCLGNRIASDPDFVPA